MAKNVAGNFDTHEDALWWKDRHWIAHVLTKQDDFVHTLLDEELRDRNTGYTDVDAKAHMYINHYGVSTGMMTSVAGQGAKYCNAYEDKDGKYLGLIKTPEQPANCKFGGKDFKTLYVTARNSLYTIPLENAGHQFARPRR